MTHLRRILTGTAIFVAACGFASADSIISYSHTTPSTQTAFSDTFTLPTFNIPTAVLTGITITITGSETAEVDVFNSTTGPLGFTNASATIPFSLTVPSDLNLVVASFSGTATLASGTANPGANPFPGITNPFSHTQSVASASWSLFETPPSGTTIGLDFIGATGTYSGTAGAGVFFGGSAVASAITTITYDYVFPSGVPEPATYALMGSALVGLGLLRKRLTGK